MKQQSINQENEKEFFTKKAAEIASLKKAGMGSRSVLEINWRQISTGGRADD